MSNPYSENPYPNIEELEQLETEESPLDIKPIPTVVDEIRDTVRAILVPNRDLVMSSVVVRDGAAVKVINDDKRRAKLTIMPLLNTGDTSTSVRFAVTKEEADGGGGALWPARPPGSAPPAPLELKTSKGIWAKMIPGDPATCTVSYIAEYWAD